MFDRQPGQHRHRSSARPHRPDRCRAERVMRIAPLDLRQQRFRTALRGFDRTEVVAFLTEAADDYEHALREIDRLRQDLLAHGSPALREHRDRETNLRNTLLTAQRLADEVKSAAENEAKMIVREAQGRADLLLQKASARLEEIERDITELRLRRRGVEGIAGVVDPVALPRARIHPRTGQAGREGPPPSAPHERGSLAAAHRRRRAASSRRPRLADPSVPIPLTTPSPAPDCDSDFDGRATAAALGRSDPAPARRCRTASDRNTGEGASGLRRRLRRYAAHRRPAVPARTRARAGCCSRRRAP